LRHFERLSRTVSDPGRSKNGPPGLGCTEVFTAFISYWPGNLAACSDVTIQREAPVPGDIASTKSPNILRGLAGIPFLWSLPIGVHVLHSLWLLHGTGGSEPGLFLPVVAPRTHRAPGVRFEPLAERVDSSTTWWSTSSGGTTPTAPRPARSAFYAGWNGRFPWRAAADVNRRSMDGK